MRQEPVVVAVPLPPKETFRTKPKAPRAQTQGAFSSCQKSCDGDPLKSLSSWKKSRAIVLISCYELGHQPIALASPTAFLHRAGYSPTVLDLAIETLDLNEILDALFVGISVPMHTALRLGVEAARRVREKNPSCHICFYGLYANLNDIYLLENVSDSVIGGEVEVPLAELIDTLANGKDPSLVRGVSTRERREEPYLEKFPLLLPHRNGLPPLKSYAHLYKDGEHLPVGTVEASRGCKHLCLHCPIPPVYKGRFYAVPREIVLEDIRGLVSQGAKHITFADPDFLNGPAHAMRIAWALHDEHPSLTFDFTAKVEHLVNNKELLPEFAGLGCIFIVSAVESLSDTVLANLAKGHTREEVLEALLHCNMSHISLRPSLLSFTPWTTADDYIELIDLIDDNGLIDHVDPIQLAIRLLVPPGADLLGTEAMQPHLGEYDPENFIHSWAHPDPRMDHLHREVLVIAEDAAAREEDTALTFGRIRAAAVQTLERPGSARPAPALDPDRPRPPRLTESWFC